MRHRKLAILLPALVGLAATQAHANINIIPTFDPTWGTDGTAASDEATITNYINATYNANILNPITVNIDISDDPSVGLGQSSTTFYSTDYNTYRQALLNTTPTNSAVINFALPVTGNPVPGNSTAGVDYTSAQGRALGFNSPGDKIVAGETGTFDSHISLNIPLIQKDGYGLTSTVGHEVNEALGLYSELDGNGNGNGTPSFQNVGSTDFFRYSAPGVRSFTNEANAVSYFSNDGGKTPIVYFNQNSGGDFHDWASGPDSGTPGTVIAAAQVQDAYGDPGSNPSQGPSEIAALKDVGYNYTNPASTPEPSQFGMMALMGLGLGGLLWRGRKRLSKESAA